MGLLLSSLALESWNLRFGGSSDRTIYPSLRCQMTSRVVA